ncbi:MAG: hypothetical protein RL092_857, partial [Bacteroidota bacterium]
SITLNDMHGKPKSQKIYANANSEASSEVEYFYKVANSNPSKLNNTVKVVEPNGNVRNADIGTTVDIVLDTRESNDISQGVGANVNLDASAIVPFYPTIFLIDTRQETKFRSITLTKVIQQLGVLEYTRATDNTSVVDTKTEAYDAVTGQPLVTSTNNHYDKPVYNVTIPAHWYYKNLGPSFQNVGYSTTINFNSAGYSTSLPENCPLIEGDELLVRITAPGYASLGNQRAWVVEAGANAIRLKLRNGQNVVGDVPLTVIKSGYKNLQSTPISQVTLLKNPIDENGYFNFSEEVIQASATEFKDEWGVYCNCFEENKLESFSLISTNPFVLGLRGNWKPYKSYAYLTDREQGYVNRNLNLKSDGTFTSFSSFFKQSANGWFIDRHNWTAATEVTKYSRAGQEIENKDALGRYSSAQFAFNNTLPNLVATNASSTQVGALSFEDNSSEDCNQLFNVTGGIRVDEYKHTGRLSILSSPGQFPKIALAKTERCYPETRCIQYSINYGVNEAVVTVQSANSYNVDTSLLFGHPSVTEMNNGVISTRGVEGDVMHMILTDSEGCSVEFDIVY